MSVHFSSDSDEWETPPWLFDELDQEFCLNFDLCATKENTKCHAYTDDIEGYMDNPSELDWGSYWMNPPYSRGKQKMCIEAAYRLMREHKKTVVMLIPARTDTAAWHSYIWDEKKHTPRAGVQVRLLKGRIKFERNGGPVLDKHGRPQAAPFPSAVVIFGGGGFARTI